MNPETFMLEDEAQLANFVTESRSSSESSSGFNFSFNPRKNLKESFDREVARLSNDHVVTQSGVAASLTEEACIPEENSSNRPPLHRNHSSRRHIEQSCSMASSENKRVAVYLRIRPPSSPNKTINCASMDTTNNNTIEILDPSGEPRRFPTRIRTYPPNVSNSYRVNINRHPKDASAYAKEFSFDCIMGPETSQRKVYSAVAAPMLQDILQSLGQPQHFRTIPPSISSRNASALLFSYGITNAGKTYTVLGDLSSRNQSNWGIIPRAISEVFDHQQQNSIAASSSARISSHQTSQLELYVSFFEIYNEQVYDLIPSEKTVSKYPLGDVHPLKVRECRGEILVSGLARHKVESTSQGIELTKIAHNKRHTSSNNINSGSSRSHFVCQMELVQASLVSGAATVQDDEDASMITSTDDGVCLKSKERTSTIWIVDLAGSERSKRTQVGSLRQKESTQINKSLMTLMRCLNAIKDNGRYGLSIVPFRESKLTHIFMSHLTSESASRTAIVVNVNPAIDDFDETQHVLAFATKARLIEMDPEEYNRKRKQYFGEEYDANGRKKVKPTTSISYPTKRCAGKKKETLFSRMAKKLSPKRVFQKIPHPENAMAGEDDYTIPTSTTCRDEVEKLQASLLEARRRIETLEFDFCQLQEELETKEDQIRSEVALEMEQRLRETRRKHQEKYRQLQAEMAREASKTPFTMKMDRAESQLEELMDKVEECEKEMMRMNRDHQEEVHTLEGVISDLKVKLNGALSGKQKGDARIERLEKELKQFKKMLHKREKQTTLQKDCKGDEDMSDTDAPENAAENVAEDSTEPLTFTLSFKKKKTAHRKNLRPRKPLFNSSNSTVE
ncbi:kinesin motor domain containing protein [Nitzschia inconspicua]|uniref:Kinesin-like protein n=1 Tax=Nitzschia inconspicua TaxID=303405 RepID=A0A9K3KYB2_9STRA|nr:kinesin motor domain containing protein [Nitzschia inconspicua]